MTFEYEIGYVQARELRLLVECEQERGAVDRLARFKGDERDVRTVAEIYRRIGEGANAAEMMRMLETTET